MQFTFTVFLPIRAVTFTATLLNASVILESFALNTPCVVHTPWGTMEIACQYAAARIAACLTEHRFAADWIIVDTSTPQ